MGVQATPPASRLCCSLPLQKQQGRLSDRPVPENASACCPGLGPSAGASGTSHRAGLQTPQGPVQPAGFRRFPPRRCHPLRPRGGDKGQAVPQRAPPSSSGPTELRRLGRAPFWPGTLRHLVRRHFRDRAAPTKPGRLSPGLGPGFSSSTHPRVISLPLSCAPSLCHTRWARAWGRNSAGGPPSPPRLCSLRAGQWAGLAPSPLEWGSVRSQPPPPRLSSRAQARASPGLSAGRSPTPG